MTKNQLLLTLAQNAVNWGEGADFEFKELIHESSNKVTEALEKYYPEHMGLEYDDEKDDDHPDNLNYEQNGSYSDAFYEKVGGDINTLLKSLIEAEKV